MRRVYAGILFILVTGLLPMLVRAEIISVAVGWSKPPYVIEDGDTGFELELVRNILGQQGHEMKTVYVPFGRAHYLLKTGTVDAAITVSENLDIGDMFLSDSYISYQNAAISLRGRDIQIEEVSDLGSYSLVGFQNASMVLGEAYEQSTIDSPFYIELPDQFKQVEMLLRGKTDVVVMDINIFNHVSRELTGKNFMDNVNVALVFPVNRYHMGFSSEKVRDDFNRELANFRITDAYRALIDKYQFIQN